MLTTEQIAIRVREVIAETLSLDTPISDDHVRLVEDLQVDSVDQVSIILALEDEFGGEIPDEQAQQVRTVADIIALVQSEMQVRAVSQSDEPTA
jgi:acyl carrier protein